MEAGKLFIVIHRSFHLPSRYVYHTEYDTADRVPLATLQRVGDNILAVVRQETHTVYLHWTN